MIEGESAAFRVEFSGCPVPAVKWYRYAFPIHNSKDFQIVTDDNSSTLTIAKTRPDDSGIFTCLLENLGGATKSSTNLNVVEEGQEYVLSASTKTSRTLKEMNVDDGDRIRFDIQFTGGDKTKLEFYHNQEKLVEGDGVKIDFENDVASLTIEKAKVSNSGLYECIMKTEGGEAKCQITCHVLEKKSKKK